MTRALAIGASFRLAGYALAGVDVLGAPDDAAVADAWERLPADATLLLLTADAHAAIADRLHERPDLLWSVIP